MGNTKQKNSLEKLTLLDRFLFAETMENPENMKILLDIILEDEVTLVQAPQTEKELRQSSLDRMARLDVWAMDDRESVYDTEVQKADNTHIPKRSRYYQGMIDSKLLEPGETDFRRLNKVYIIVITPFDLFGKGLYKYTFYNTCEEVPGLKLGDDAVRIFLNTRGTNDKDVSNELIQLLHYMENTNDSEMLVVGGRLQRLQENVKAIQQNAEMGVKYMQLWEEMALMRLEGRAEGRAEALAESRATMILEVLETKSAVAGDVRVLVMEQKDLDVLKKWFKDALKAESVDEFMEMIK